MQAATWEQERVPNLVRWHGSLDNALYQACGTGGDADVRRLLAAGATPSLHAVTQACDSENAAALATLLRAGAPTSPFHLHRAVSDGHTEIVRLLLDAGETQAIDEPDGEFAYSTIRRAACDGFADIVVMCIRALGNRPASIFSALGAASSEGRTRVVRALLAMNPTQAAKDDALFYAASYGHEEVAESLLAAGANANSVVVQRTVIVCAAAGAHWGIVRKMLLGGASARDANDALLKLAILDGNTAMAQELRRLGCVVDARTERAIRDNAAREPSLRPPFAPDGSRWDFISWTERRSQAAMIN